MVARRPKLNIRSTVPTPNKAQMGRLNLWEPSETVWRWSRCVPGAAVPSLETCSRERGKVLVLLCSSLEFRGSGTGTSLACHL
jgi:hypothetical protein